MPESVLETEFPLQSATVSPSRRSLSQDSDAEKANTLASHWTTTKQHRRSGELARDYPAVSRLSGPSIPYTHHPQPCVRGIATNSKRTTTLNFANVCETPTEDHLDHSEASNLNGLKNATLRRSGSLRKACHNDEDEGDESDEVGSPELEPLFQVQRSQGTATTTISPELRLLGPNRHRFSTAPSVAATISSATQHLGQGQYGRPSILAHETCSNPSLSRHRKHDEDSMSAFSRCWLGILVLVAQILLNGVMALCLFWVIQYHSQDGVPFAWKSNPKLEFNLHPVLMIAGFIYFMGQAMILYRTCRCCRRIWNKLLHTILHILAIPCIVIGFIAVLDSHNLRKDKDGNPAPIPNFYSLHSWIGLTVMGLFALQFVIGFFSFLLLLCCESATASFRANLVPIHAAFGGTTFVLAVAAACTGLTEKAFFSLSLAYSKWVPYLSDRNFEASTALTGLTKLGPEYTQEIFEQSLVINALGAGLVALAIVIPVILAYPKFRYRPQRVITVTHDRYG